MKMSRMFAGALFLAAAVAFGQEPGDGEKKEEHFKATDFPVQYDSSPIRVWPPGVDDEGKAYDRWYDPATGVIGWIDGDTGFVHDEMIYYGDEALYAAMSAMGDAINAKCMAEAVGGQLTNALKRIEEVTESLWDHKARPVGPTGGETAHGTVGATQTVLPVIGFTDDANGYAITADSIEFKDGLAKSIGVTQGGYIYVSSMGKSGNLADANDYGETVQAIKDDVIAGIDAMISETAGGLDDVVREEFAAADIVVEQKLMGVIQAYHPDEELPDEATNVLAKVAFSGKYEDLVDIPPSFTNECVIVKDGDTYNVYPPGGGGEAATNAVGGLAELAVSGEWGDITGFPAGGVDVMTQLSIVLGPTTDIVYRTENVIVTEGGLVFKEGGRKTYSITLPGGGGGGTDECHCAGCEGGGGDEREEEDPIFTAWKNSTWKNFLEAMNGLETRVGKNETDIQALKDRLREVLGEIIGVGYDPPVYDFDPPAPSATPWG